MALQNDAGEPTFTGDPDIQVDYPALQQAVMYDESEGIAAWYIGYDGTGCVTLVQDGLDIVVVGAGPAGLACATAAAERGHRVVLMERDEYVRTVVDFLELLPPSVIIERISGDAPPDYFVGPSWCLDKPAVRAALDAELARRDTWQGKKTAQPS